MRTHSLAIFSCDGALEQAYKHRASNTIVIEIATIVEMVFTIVLCLVVFMV